jgi:thiamine-phosphate pyrophosphorylase
MSKPSQTPANPQSGTEQRPACQLYLLSPPTIGSDFADRFKAVAETVSIAAFQLRLKGIDDHAIARAGEGLRTICSDLDIAFIVNDSISLAKRLGADGVHLGQEDGDLSDARDVLGRDAQIGVTCHNSRHLAMEAGDKGADYVAFGAFYPSVTKEVKHHADIELLSWWSSMFELPCVAIGGVTVENAQPLIAAGADFIAVSGAIWSDPKGEVAAAEAFRQLLAS